ncbi:MAG: hypothetical protein QXG03_07110 [Halalkalicoccus sp.]
MTSRKNAMLTTEDRRWLTGEKSYEGEHAKQQRYQRRRDIRDRVYNSILDFPVLFEHLEESERRKLFEVDGGLSNDPELRRGVRDGLAFLLYNAGITGAMGEDGGPGTTAHRLLREAIGEAGRKDGYVVEDVAIEIDARPADPSRLRRKLAAGEELSGPELVALLDADAVDADEVQALIREMILEDVEMRADRTGDTQEEDSR